MTRSDRTLIQGARHRLYRVVRQSQVITEVVDGTNRGFYEINRRISSVRDTLYTELDRRCGELERSMEAVQHTMGLNPHDGHEDIAARLTTIEERLNGLSDRVQKEWP